MTCNVTLPKFDSNQINLLFFLTGGVHSAVPSVGARFAASSSVSQLGNISGGSGLGTMANFTFSGPLSGVSCSSSRLQTDVSTAGSLFPLDWHSGDFMVGILISVDVLPRSCIPSGSSLSGFPLFGGSGGAVPQSSDVFPSGGSGGNSSNGSTHQASDFLSGVSFYVAFPSFALERGDTVSSLVEHSSSVVTVGNEPREAVPNDESVEEAGGTVLGGTVVGPSLVGNPFNGSTH